MGALRFCLYLLAAERAYPQVRMGGIALPEPSVWVLTAVGTLLLVFAGLGSRRT